MRIIANREEISKVSPRGLRAVPKQVTIDFDRVQEIRIRTQKPLLLICGGREYAIRISGSLVVGVPDSPVRDIRGSGRYQEQERYWARAGIITVSQAQIREIMEYMCSLSVYAAEEGLRQRLITIQGGRRIDMTGRTIAFGQDIRLMKSIFSINIRVAHQIQDCASQIMDCLCSDDGRFLNILVISPPRCGKTTLLRDAIRRVSDGLRTQRSDRRVTRISMGAADERSELGTCYQGVPQDDLGVRTNALDCCPGSQDMMMLVGSMTPQVVAVDEIGSREDMQTIEYVRNYGCSLVATIHSNSLEDVMQKPVVGGLVQRGISERMTPLDYQGMADHVAFVWGGRGDVLYADEDGEESESSGI